MIPKSLGLNPVLGHMKAVTGMSCSGFESVIYPYGSDTPSDNTLCLFTSCAANNLSILDSWFKRWPIHRTTWYSRDGRTPKELGHIILRDRCPFQLCRVFRGAECAANTDHSLVTTAMSVRFYRPRKQSLTKILF